MGKIEDNERFVRKYQLRRNLKVDGWAGGEVNGDFDMLVPAKPFNPKPFYDDIRARLFDGSLSGEQVMGLNAKLASFEGQPLAFVAYMLATAYHETDKTMMPIEEYGKGRGKPYGKAGRNGGQIPYGRGDVQLTWDENYERADKKLGLGGALIRDYSKALEPNISAAIMVNGMREGWFTGKGLFDYLPDAGPATRTQYREARRIINGTDKADLIAGYAMVFQSALMQGGWQ